MKIEITQADIDAGVPGSNEYCPLAIVVGRSIKQATKVHVGCFTVEVYFSDDVFETYAVDAAGNQFIRDFDRGINPPPCIVMLTKVEELTPLAQALLPYSDN